MRIIILGMLTHPRASPENLSPAKILPAAMAISNISKPAVAMCLELALLKMGVERCKMSSKPIIIRLKRQLPKIVPKARSGSPTKAAALTLVTSSGMEVMRARRTRPIHILPKPVFSPMASPYRASFVPENKMMARHRTNFNQTNVL